MARQSTIVWIRGDNGAPLSYESLKGADFIVLPSPPAQAGRQIAELRPAAVVIEQTPFSPETGMLCERISGLTHSPVIVMSETADEDAMVKAFSAGAADYLVLPQEGDELRARLQALVRNGIDIAGRADAGAVRVGEVELFPDESRAVVRGEPVNLTATEFRLLLALARAGGRPVDHRALIATVWGPEYVDCRHYLRLYIRYLRGKVEKDPENPRIVLNEWGVGYFLRADMAEAA
jgi:two-component system KDP operon response regulator KdpE